MKRPLCLLLIFCFCHQLCDNRCAGELMQVPAQRSSNPNVVFISIDDLNDWCGPLGGHPMVQTPHMDRLAKSGVTFLNAHCNSPLCNSSRSSLLTGLRPATTGIYGLEPSFRSLPDWADVLTLPQYFAAHGYRTLGAGKVFHWGVHSIAPAVKQRLEHLSRLEPDFMVAGPAGGIGVRPPEKLIGVTPMGNNPLMDWGTFPHSDDEKGDYQVASWVVEQLRQQPKETPFFIAAGFFLPHVPCYATQKWFDLYPDDESILPDVLPMDREDTPRFSWYLHWELPEPRLNWLQDSGQWIPLVRSYLACVSFVDAQVGRILDALEEQDLIDNTVIVLWSDHGWHLGEKQITGKNSLWDTSTRVPLIFSGPGVAAGATCDQPAELLDIYPTLIELCGLSANQQLEGLSLTPQLGDANTPRQRPAITTHNPGNHGIRSQNFRYIRYADGTEEFYDHRTDPKEWINLIDSPDYQTLIERHRKWIPESDSPPAPGSAHRILTYDPDSDTAVWEGQAISRSDPIPE
jgi:choline-sulfatase